MMQPPPFPERILHGPAGPLISNAGGLWTAATTAAFLNALAAGTLPGEAFRRWLSQDYLFAKGLLSYQAILLAKVPRDCHGAVVAGLVALDNELSWFEGHAERLGLDLRISPHPVCRTYIDFLLRSANSLPYSVLLAILFGVEASYLAAWSALEARGPYAEFIARWSSAAFADYVAALGDLAGRHRHDDAQSYLNRTLEHERDFWRMSFEG